MLDWGLTAAALLLFLYAVRTVFVASKGEGQAAGQRLGCGFALVAVVLWIYVINRHLENPREAIQIGLGALLVLPAIQALANPRRAKILRAAAGLVLAFLLAGPALQELWQRHGPDSRSEVERGVAGKIEELESLKSKLMQRSDSLGQLRDEVRGNIEASGKDWEALQADPAMLDQLQLLHLIDEQLATVNENLAQVELRLPALRASLEQEHAPAPTSAADAELEALLDSLNDAPPLDELSLTEQHARQLELQALFEDEF